MPIKEYVVRVYKIGGQYSVDVFDRWFGHMKNEDFRMFEGKDEFDTPELAFNQGQQFVETYHYELVSAGCDPDYKLTKENYWF